MHVKHRVPKKSWRSAMLLLTLISATASSQSAWAACGGVTDGLVACYPFDGNTNDESGNSLNGSVVGTPNLTADRFGNGGKAYYFDGKSYINVGNSPKLDVNYHTITAWVKPEPKTSQDIGSAGRQIVGKVKPNTYETLSFGLEKDNYFSTGFATGSEINHPLKSSSIIENNQWHFVAMSYDGTKVTLYRDGLADASYPRTGTVRTNTNSLAIGRHGGDANQLGDDNFFKGTMDEVRIYNRALTEAEIKQLYNAPTNPNSECSNPAMYDAETGLVTLPAIDIPLLSPISGEPTGEIAVFSGKIKQTAGVEDFEIIGNSLNFIKIISQYDLTHARYEYNEGIFSNGGKLKACASVPSIAILPPNTRIVTGSKNYRVSLRHLAVSPSILHLESAELVTP